MQMLADGVYVDGPLRFLGSVESPRSIVTIRDGLVTISLNPHGGAAFAQEHDVPVGRLRRYLSEVDEHEVFVRISHERLIESWGVENGFANGVVWFDWESDDARHFSRIADSWWSDFDVFVDLAHPMLLAGARLIGPTRWLVTVYNRHRYHDHNLGSPLLRFEVGGVSGHDLKRRVKARRSEIFRMMFDW
jgi:hypothetical protein